MTVNRLRSIMDAMDNLKTELEVYNNNLPSLLKDEGKYVVIFKQDVLGTYVAYDDALKAGYEKAALEPFLVKRIAGTETVAYFSREIGGTCHTPQP